MCLSLGLLIIEVLLYLQVEAARLMADSVEPDQILHSAESDLDLLCFCDIFVTPDINDYCKPAYC